MSVPADSPLARERLWLLAEHIVRRPNGSRPTTIAVDELRDKVEQLMEHVRATVSSTWDTGSFRYDSNDVRWLHAQLAHVADEVLHNARPLPDREGPRQGWAWQGYSPELILRVAREVLRDAIVGYRHLVEVNFPTLGSALGLYSALPVRAEGLVVMPEDDAQGDYSGLLYTLRPETAGRHDAAPLVELGLWTEPGFGPSAPFPVVPVASKSSFHRPVSELRDFMTTDLRPATALAYEWLIRDLKAVGWLSDTTAFA